MGEIYVTEDLVLNVAEHFGCRKGDACYVAWMDLNGDGLIGVDDIGQFAQSIGTNIHVPQGIDLGSLAPLVLLGLVFFFDID